eukprot:1890832-Pleurochrysis_carterae.AAC.3
MCAQLLKLAHFANDLRLARCRDSLCQRQNSQRVRTACKEKRVVVVGVHAGEQRARTYGRSPPTLSQKLRHCETLNKRYSCAFRQSQLVAAPSPPPSKSARFVAADPGSTESEHRLPRICVSPSHRR